MGKHKLVKLPMSLKHPFKSFYVNLTDGEIIDCSGYIEERCLHQISEQLKEQTIQGGNYEID